MKALQDMTRDELLMKLARLLAEEAIIRGLLAARDEDLAGVAPTESSVSAVSSPSRAALTTPRGRE